MFQIAVSNARRVLLELHISPAAAQNPLLDTQKKLIAIYAAHLVLRLIQNLALGEDLPLRVMVVATTEKLLLS